METVDGDMGRKTLGTGLKIRKPTWKMVPGKSTESLALQVLLLSVYQWADITDPLKIFQQYLRSLVKEMSVSSTYCSLERACSDHLGLVVNISI